MLLQANMVKRIIADEGGDLEAKAGESLRLRRIECIPSASDDYLTISVARVTLAYYRIKGKSGNHLGTLHENFIKGNIMEFLTAQGINVTIPIAEGQTLNVKRADEAGDVVLIYDRYSAGDVKETDPNGSASNVYTFLQYAVVGDTPVADGDYHINTALTPSEFPDFPCDRVVPALCTIELLGIAASPFHQGHAYNTGFESNYLKLVRNREVLFDAERKGIPFEGRVVESSSTLYQAGFSLIGSGAEARLAEAYMDSMGNPQAREYTTLGQPLMFDPALKFSAGEELRVELTVTKTGVATWVAGVDDLAFILRVRKT